MLVPKIGEIYRTCLAGDHFVVIVSREELNRGDYVVVVPVTSQHFARRSALRNCVSFRTGRFGFVKDCVAQAENVTLMEKTDLIEQVGAIDVESMREVVRALGFVFDAECEPGSP